MTSTSRALRRYCLMVVVAALAACGQAPDDETARSDAEGTRVALVTSAPTITSFVPTSAVQGTYVTVTGTNFMRGASVAFNGGAAVPAIYLGTTKLRAKVPAGATSGPLTVTTTIAPAATSGTQLDVLARITTVTPSRGHAGQTVRLAGNGFTGVTALTFGSVAAAFTVVSDNTIDTTFPPTAVTSKINITKPEGTASSPASFTKLIRLSSFTPLTGLPGATVTLTGTGFVGTTAVLFGAVPATFAVQDDSTIAAVVPALATASSRILVKRATVRTMSSATFAAIQPPLITSFTPATSVLPVAVGINGQNLASTTVVRLGDVLLSTFSVVSSTRINVMVPAGTPSGRFSLTNPAGTGVSSATFTSLGLCDNVVCEPGDACHTAGTCDPDTGTCSAPGPSTCAVDVLTSAHLSASAHHTCEVRDAGDVRCWGFSPQGQVGSGTSTAGALPSVVPGLAGVVAVTAGYDHTCALLSTRHVSCWGGNNYGELGTGSYAQELAPQEVVGLSDAVVVTAGAQHTCAVRASGEVACWGHNDYGQLGNGSTNDAATPVAVPGLTDIVDLEAGVLHSCALARTGEVYCWGYGGDGQLGHGLASDSSLPVQVSGLTDAVAVAAGLGQTCALRMSGQVVCWGQGTYGALGHGSYDGSTAPVAVVGLTDAVALSAGANHVCAVRQEGGVACWGYGGNGQLGDGSQGISAGPVASVGVANAIAVAAAAQHTCAKLRTGEVLCWGQGSHGELGSGLQGPSSLVAVHAVGDELATVPTGLGSEGIALNPVTHTVYVANYADGAASTVTIVDGITLSRASVSVGRGPFDVAVNSVTNKVYVANYGTSHVPDNTVSVIDGVTNQVSSITVGPNPYFVRVNETTNMVYVTQYGFSGHQVTVIDGATDSVVATIDVGSQPAGLAINEVTNKIYVANFTGNSVSVVDGATNSVVTVATGPWPQYVAVNSVTNKVYAANSHGTTVTVIDGVTNATTAVAVGTSPMGLAVNETTNVIYVANYDDGSLSVIDGSTHQVTTVDLEAGAYFPYVDPATHQVFVVNVAAGSVSFVDGETLADRAMAVGQTPFFAAHDSALRRLYVANSASNNVTVIDTTRVSSPTVWTPLVIAESGQNPSGPWTAGWGLTAAGADLNQFYAQQMNANGGGMWCLFDPTNVSSYAPNFCHNPGEMAYGVPQGHYTLHGGCRANEYAVMRFTVPGAGRYRADLSLLPGDSGQITADVLVNGTVEITTGPLATGWSDTLGARNLAAGDTIELAIGTAADGCWSDTTPISFVVTREGAATSP